MGFSRLGRAVCFMLISSASAQLQFFPQGIQAERNISTKCQTALNATVSICPNAYLYYPITNYGGPFTNTTIRDAFCSSGCTSALSTYRSKVDTDCAADLDPWDGLPAEYSADRMIAYQKRICLKNPSNGQYCTEFFTGYGLADQDYAITDLPQGFKCSSCYLQLLQAMQATPYSSYDEGWVDSYAAIQTSCGVKYPTNVLPAPWNDTKKVPPGITYPNDTNPYCLSGKTVTVASGSNCQAIAEANKVSTGTLRVINNLYPDCSNLIAGATLCLPMACNTYKVKSGDTCWSIATAYSSSNVTFSDIVSYNPTLNNLCNNLIAGENICVTPAGGNFTPTAIPGASATQNGIYATKTVAPPGPTAAGTTKNCGQYYKVKTGDDCGQISLNNTITVDLFRAINPSINDRCSNLVADLWYCVSPTATWNSTAASTTVGSSVTQGPPAPTASGTTKSCYKWYTVQSGDYCSLITSSYGITFAQFQQWNPAIDNSCSNLVLGNAYCVDGGKPASTTTTTTAKSTTTSPKTTTTTSKPSSTVSTTTSTSKTTTASTSVSTNGVCGPGISCVGSGFGNCCSIYGYCGSTSDYCSKANCQSGACSST